jgi:hypothetical protein
MNGRSTSICISKTLQAARSRTEEKRKFLWVHVCVQRKKKIIHDDDGGNIYKQNSGRHD